MKRFLTYVSAALALVCSCDSSRLELPANEEHLIVEGWIENGHPPIVVVSTSLPVSADPIPLSEVENHIVRYATVSVEVDGEIYYLTSRSSDFFAIKNYYSSSELYGEAGKTYKLKVRYDDYCASAVCTIPEPPSIASVTARQETDSTFFAELVFSNSPEKEMYYQTFLRTGENGLFSSVPTSALKGGEAENRVVEFFGPFKQKEVLEIKLATTEKPIYDFWCSYQTVATMTGNLNVSLSSNIGGNVDGALGYWAGYGIDVMKVTFEK